MRGRARAHYAAVVTPAGLHVIRYRRKRRLLEVERYRGSPETDISIRGAADRLADLLEAEGARGGSVSVAVAGFGTCHHLLALPPAAPDLLEPILQREMRRFFPDLYEKGQEQPYLAAVPTGSTAGSETPLREQLVGAIPRHVIHELNSALASRAIALAHVTVLPAAVARLHQSYVESPGTTVLALVMQQYSVAGFFHEGSLRLFTEPPVSAPDQNIDPARRIGDQVERGVLYLRQQFRGATPSTIWLAADPERTEQIEERIGVPEGMVVRSLDPGEPPGSLLALGAALDAQDEAGLNLLPHEFRPPSRAERWTRGLGVAAAAVLLLATSWWAVAGVRAEADAAERLRALQETLVPRSAAYSRIQPVIAERQAHSVRSEILQRIVAEREKVPELLWPLQDAQPTISMGAFHLNRTPDGWQGLVQGTATSWSSSDAAAAVEALHQQLGQELPPGSIQLDDLSYGGTGEAEQMPTSVAVSFRMSFIVPLEEWAAQ